MVESAGAIGGVNADFFPFTGDPLGLMIRDGVLISAPSKRAAFGWSAGGAFAGIASLEASMGLPDGRLVPLDGLNEEWAVNALSVFGEQAGFVLSKEPSATALLKIIEGGFTPGADLKLEVTGVGKESLVAVPKGGAVIMGHGSKAHAVESLKVGDKVSVSLALRGADWQRITQAVGGGPFLVRHGRMSIDWDSEGFNPAFALRRHPRTAVGRTRGGDVWFVTIDGRQSSSLGATLEETARIMVRLGCVDAINLDGGGSTTFNLYGQTLNRPSDGSERPVANGVLFSLAENAVCQDVDGDGKPPIQPDSRLLAPARLAANESAVAKVFAASGVQVANSRIVWSAAGDAWIDQGGRIWPLKEGRAIVAARVGGASLRAEIEITRAVASPPKKSNRRGK
jgi:hypothetical protein